jgi:hypothetical protein
MNLSDLLVLAQDELEVSRLMGRVIAVVIALIVIVAIFKVVAKKRK